MLIAFLAAAVILAVGLDRLHLATSGWASRWWASALRVLVPAAVGVVALVPLVPNGDLAADPVPVPTFFHTAADVARIPAGSVVLPYPNAQEPTTLQAVFPEVRSMLWQASTGFHFKMIGAYAAQANKDGTLGQGNQLFALPPVVQQIFGWALYGTPAVEEPDLGSASSLAALRHFCEVNDISTILVDPGVGVRPQAVVQYVTAALGRGPERIGGLDAWFGVAS